MDERGDVDQHCVCDVALKWARIALKNAAFQGLNCPNSDAFGKKLIFLLFGLFSIFKQLRRLEVPNVL